MTVFDFEFYFNTTMRTILPKDPMYWMEFDFFFDKIERMAKDASIFFYTQMFFNYTSLRWQRRKK